MHHKRVHGKVRVCVRVCMVRELGGGRVCGQQRVCGLRELGGKLGQVCRVRELGGQSEDPHTFMICGFKKEHMLTIILW